MPAKGERYAKQPVSVTIGQAKIIELAPRVFRGHLTGAMFDRDKTFLLPDAVPGMRELKAFYDRHPGAAILVVGHTDRTGADAHNRALSEERAQAVVAFLTDDVATWLGYYGKGHTGKPWGRLEDQYMAAAIGGYTGITSGQHSRLWQAAVSALGATGKDLHDAARRDLITRYLKQAGTTLPAGVALATHGCGASHLADPASGETADRKNRRVEIFLFEDKVEPTPAAHCPSGGCAQHAQWVKRSTPLEQLGSAPGTDIVLALEWGADLVERLPRDTVVKLTPADLPAIELRPGDAVREHDAVRLEFPLPHVPATTCLEATAGSKTVVIWKDRGFGDIAIATDWAGALDELLPDEPEPEDGEVVQTSSSVDALPPLPEPT